MSVLRLAVAQAHTLSNTPSTLTALEEITKNAAMQNVDLILFPEAYLGGYPRKAVYGIAAGAREPDSREEYLRYYQDAVDLGDTPEGAGIAWVERLLEVPRHGDKRGDGTRETLERIAKDTNIFLIVGLVERTAGILYGAVVYVCPSDGIIGKRRKVILAGSERTIWGQGQTHTLRAIKTSIRGVELTLAAAICWENYMPLLRQSLYSQNVNLYLAPTSDDRETWLPLIRTIAQEGRCFVLSANQCRNKFQVPDWTNRNNFKSTENIAHEYAYEYADDVSLENGAEWNSILPLKLRNRSIETDKSLRELSSDEAAFPPMKPRKESEAEGTLTSRGGSCIVGPLGDILAGPLWNQAKYLSIIDVDFDDCIKGKLDLDIGGNYLRNDCFRLSVYGLNLNPPA